VAAQLAAAGADCDIHGWDGQVALHQAAHAGNVQLVEALLAAGANPLLLTETYSSLHLAAEAGHGEVVAVLLAAPAAGGNPDVCNLTYRNTALHAAAAAGQHEVVQQLAAAGANVNKVRVDTEATPLIEAIRARCSLTVAALLAVGAEPNRGHGFGSALYYAVRVGAHEVIPVLVEGGANTVYMDSAGATAVHMAISSRQYAILEQLIGLGADLGRSSNQLGTPLHYAVELGDTFAVRALAAASAAPLNTLSSITASSSSVAPCTPLYLAVVKGAAELVGILVAAGADVNVGTSTGDTPLHAALQHQHVEVAEQLLAVGADVNAVSEQAGSVLGVAVQRCEQAMQQQLLEAGADPTLGSKRVLEPLLTAVLRGDTKLLQRLLAAPAITAAAAMQPSAAAGAGGGAAMTAQPNTQQRGGLPSPSSNSSSDIVRRMGRTLQAAVRMKAWSEVTVSMLLEAGAPPNSQGDGGAAPLHLAMSGVAHSAAVDALVGRLLAAGADPNLVSARYGTPLAMAVAAKDIDLVQRLLAAGADPNLACAKHGAPLAMAVAARDGELVKRLLAAGAGPDKVPPGCDALLLTAARLGDAGIAGQLLDAGAGVNAAGKRGLTALHWAASAGHEQVVGLLVQRGVAVDACSEQGTPLRAAVMTALEQGKVSQRLGVFSTLLQAHADPNAAHSSDGSCLLHAAAAGGKVQLVEVLVAAGAALDAVSRGRTPLQLAVAAGAEDVVQVLLKEGASPNAGGGEAEGGAGEPQASPLEVALDKGYAGIAKALLDAGADPTVRHSKGCGSLILAAVHSNNRAAVEQLLAVDSCREDLKSAAGSMRLQQAVRQRHDKMAVLLLKGGASPNVVCRFTKRTLLQEALEFPPRPDLALQLLEARADPNQGKECATPLQLAVRHNLCEVARLLLAKGADASVVHSDTGDTLLHVAVRSNFTDMVELLVEASAPVNAANREGETPLLMTMPGGQVCLSESGQRLLDHKHLNLEVRDKDGCSALHHAARRRDAWAIDKLLRHGADPSATDSQGRTPLHLAVTQGHLAGVKLLAPQGAPVSSSSNDPNMCARLLQLAVMGGYGDMLKWLLGTGAAEGVSAATDGGTTALHLACVSAGAEQMVADLLAVGAALNAVNSTGDTPLHIAAAAGAEGTVRRLLAAGARVGKLNSNNELPLHLALAMGHMAVAQQLIAAAKTTSQQLWVNTVSAAGVALIHLAAAGPSSLPLQELLQCQGVQVDIVDGAGQTAVHKAAAAGRAHNLRLLVQRGASVGMADAAGVTPLHLAAAAGCSKCMRRLVRWGAEHDAVDATGATPLHKAGLTISHEVAALLATPSNTRRLVGGTTLLHQAAATGRQGWVTALLEAGASAGQKDSQGESVLARTAKQGSIPMLSLLLRHLLWQHNKAGAATAGSSLLPEVVVVATRVALANCDKKSVLLFSTVMEVLGEGAATTLWQQLTGQVCSNAAQPGNPPEQQQQQQQPLNRGPGDAQQRLGHVAVSALLQGFLDAVQALAEQRKGITQPLEQALQTGEPHTAAAAATPAGGRPLAAHAAAKTAATYAAAKPATIAEVSAAAGRGQQQQVQQLLQQLPTAARTAALEDAARAAAHGGHHPLCVQLVQQLAAVNRDKARGLVERLVQQWEACMLLNVKCLGQRSMGLCAALLSGWQAVRRQQQEQLVDAVVSAVVAWQQEQQQQQVRDPAGKQRKKRHHVMWADQQRPVRGLWPMGAAAVLVQAVPAAGNPEDALVAGAQGNLQAAAGDVGGAAPQQQEALSTEAVVLGDLPAAAGDSDGAGAQQQEASPPKLSPQNQQKQRKLGRVYKQLK
jgi:ankyrin repeat protein